MFVPLRYNVRSVTQRWRNTGATILAVALAVAVIVTILALQGGIERALATTGTPGNVIIMRDGATGELNSLITRVDSPLVVYMPGIARTSDGQPFASIEVLTVENLPRLDNPDGSNVNVRGVGPLSRDLRPYMRLVEGRWFQRGAKEVVTSAKMVSRFGLTLGSNVSLGRSDYTVVGIIDAAGTSYESEIWSDIEDIRADYNMDNYNTVFARLEPNYQGPILRLPANRLVDAGESPESTEAAAEDPLAGLKNKTEFSQYVRAKEALHAGLRADSRLSHIARWEEVYYSEQTAAAGPLRALGFLLGIVMGPGAALAAMNAMYAAIASRVREIGTLRVLGYRRFAILIAFQFEALVLAFMGGILGCAFSYALIEFATRFNLASFGTINFGSFSELVFQFNIEPGYLVAGIVFSLAIGLFGGFLPAAAAARLPMLSALKST